MEKKVNATAEGPMESRTPGFAWAYLATITLGAFLLFEVQPLIARYLLPWFGGSIEVWTTCMLFFQVMLVLGYLYAHAITRWLPLRGQVGLHGAVLVSALAFLPVIPSDRWKPTGVGAPTLRILLLLFVTIGLPFFALSATSPLLQSWISKWRPGRNIYRLYALSNVGSLLALVSYPVLVEPLLARRTQSWAWSLGLILFAVTCALCGWPVWKLGSGPDEPARSASPAPGTGDGRWTTLQWLLLPAAGSMMLLASTNMICLDVASFPFLWVLPLTIYLLTFIMAFAGDRWYSRNLYLTLAVLAGAGVAALRYGRIGSPSIVLQVLIYMTAMFACCMVCHGETYRLRPPAERLTSFYLLISVGGAVGGLMVAVVAPLVFRGYWELYIAMALCLALGIGAMRPEEKRQVGRRRSARKRPEGEQQVQRWRLARAVASVAVLCAGLLMVVVDSRAEALGRTLVRSRNFYGVLRVREMTGLRRPDKPDMEFTLRELQNGPINHGGQLYDVRPDSGNPGDAALAVAEARATPTTYFGRKSGGGIAMQFHPEGAVPPRRIGIIGLGAGTLAVYGRPGDSIRYYEINPDVAVVAERDFTFLSDCRNRGARLDVELGDGRLSLQREPRKTFDVLVVDAFSGDAIPVHLLTREAFALYLDRLRDDGILAIHVSNRHVALAGEVGRVARSFDIPQAFIHNRPDPRQRELTESGWVLLSRNPAFLADSAVKPYLVESRTAGLSEGPPWTDDFSSLLGAMRW